MEIADDSWKTANGAGLKSLWRERRTTNATLDLSGVWRFRELLPLPETPAEVITLREGNTPLYDLPLCSRITGVDRLYAKHQGMNPTGSFKDTGMTVAATFAASGEMRMGRVRIHRQYVGFDGRVRCPRRAFVVSCSFLKEKFPGANFRRLSTMEPSLASSARISMAAFASFKTW